MSAPYRVLQELTKRAHRYVKLKLPEAENLKKESRKRRRRIIHQIIKEQKNNRTQLHFSIFALIVLLAKTESEEQYQLILQVLAAKMAQLKYPEDIEIHEFILLKGQTKLMNRRYFKEVFSMCWVLTWNFGIHQENELDAIRTHLNALRANRLDYFFDRNRYEKLHPQKIA